MKKLVLLYAVVATLTTASLRADITMDFQVGVLANSTGSMPIVDGSLFQVIASPDSTFSAPTPTSFLGSSSNDVLVWSGAFNGSTLGGPNSGIAEIIANNVTLAPNDYLVVRWYPTLTSISLQPGSSTSYGEYGYANDNTWVVGADGSTTTYSFLTQSSGFGSASNSLGYASKTVTPVPEPASSVAIVGLCSAVAAIRWRHRRS